MLGYIALVVAALALWHVQPFMLLTSLLCIQRFTLVTRTSPTRLVEQVQLGRQHLRLTGFVLQRDGNRFVCHHCGNARRGSIGQRYGGGRIGSSAHLCLASQTAWRCGGGFNDLCMVCWVAGALVAFTCYFVFSHPAAFAALARSAGKGSGCVWPKWVGYPIITGVFGTQLEQPWV
ncbi:MAG: hypothetical protein CM15mP68_2170 [Pseudomonadota bacterium]|nr:MAG: hypothetical protein CM15mP68_2170 [Pseudomonadota bacterium]